jgi:peptide/nickel transport system permease protein
MALLIARRIGVMLLIMLTVSITLFALLESNPDGIARKARGQFTTLPQRMAWLSEENYYVSVSEAGKAEYAKSGHAFFAYGEEGFFMVAQPPPEGVEYPQKRLAEMNDDEASLIVPLEVPLLKRFGVWVSRVAVGDFGFSYRFKVPVSDILWPRLYETGKLMGLVLLFMVPLSLLLGVLAGMREGGWQDRIFSVIAIFTTSVPEFASAVIWVAIFVFWLGWLPGTSSMTEGFSWSQMILPTLVITLYGTGYIARITRASMADVMRSQFIRTAVLKGLPYKRVIVRHALRNALITPVTAIMLQIPWLLNGVIVVEYFFAYKGFGTLLWEAIDNTDPFLIEACALVSVFVVVMSQVLTDIFYAYINPRIRFQ